MTKRRWESGVTDDVVLVEQLISDIVDHAYSYLQGQESDASPSVEIIAPVYGAGLWGARLLVEEEDGTLYCPVGEPGTPELEVGDAEDILDALEELLRRVEGAFGD